MDPSASSTLRPSLPDGRVALTNLLGLLALPLLAYLIFLGANAGSYVLEMQVQSGRPAVWRLDLDDGGGVKAAPSSVLNVPASRTFSTVRFEFRASRLAGLRLHLDRTTGFLRVGSAVLRSQADELLIGDRVLAALGANRFHAVNGSCTVTPLSADAGVEINVDPAADDPVCTLGLPQPLVLGFNFRGFLEGLIMAGLLYGGLTLAGLMVWRRLVQTEGWRYRLQGGRTGLEAGYTHAARFVQTRPGSALWLAALAGVLLSCYPIVFCGKSFVSPNMGAPMLYAAFPTLPGFKSKTTNDPQGSDISAMMWAFAPYAATERRAVFDDHEFPFWNRYNGTGVPLLGQGQSMIGDPLHWIVLLGGANALSWDIKFLLAKLFFAAGVGLMVRTATRHVPTAALLGFSSCFLGFFTYRFDHPAFFSMCYAPWIFYAWLEIARCGAVRRWLALLLLANWCEMNSGTVKEAYMLLFGLNAGGLLTLLLSTALPWRRKGTTLLVLQWTGLCFALVAAPVWWTLLDTIVHSWSEYNTPYVYQLQPGMFVGLFDDVFYRQFNGNERTLDPSMNFVFLLGVALAVGCAKTLVRRERTLLAAGMAGTAAAALAFGVIPAGFIKAVPFLGNVIHCDNTFSALLMINLFVVAGHGLAHGWRRFEKREWGWDMAAAAMFLFVLIGAFLGLTQAAQRSDTNFLPLNTEVAKSAFFWMDTTALVTAFLALPWLARRFCLDRGATAPGLAPWVLLCLGVMLWRQSSHQPLRAGLGRYAMVPAERGDFFAHSGAVEFLHSHLHDHPGRVQGLGDNFMPGTGGIFGLETPSGPDALQNLYFHRLMLEAGVPLEWKWRLDLDARTAGLVEMRRLYDMLNVRYYLAGLGSADVPGLQRVGRFDLDVFESETAWPRAFFIDQVESCHGNMALLTRTIRGDGRPYAAIEPDELALRPELAALVARDGANSGRQMAPAYNYKVTNNTTTFRVHAPAAGVVALLEGYDRAGVVATVNGQTVPHFRVDGTFVGVYLQAAGDYVVNFHYRPYGWAMAVSACGLGLAFLVVTGIWTLLRQAMTVRRWGWLLPVRGQLEDTVNGKQASY